MLFECYIISFILSLISTNDEIIDETHKNIDMVVFSECFEDIGCIEVTEEWYHSKYRPVNYKPLDRHIIKTEFLIIREDCGTLIFEKSTATIKSITNAGYQRGSDTIIAIHDFTSDGYTGWIKHLASVVLDKYTINLVSVDWESGAEPPFDQAIANARVVALEIIAFVNVLLTLGTCKDNIHLIGHGVGAHIAGYVGQEIKDLKKISGLDPTGPRFQYMPEMVRLHADCAKYVEILHTDSIQSSSQGTLQLMGDADFFINDANIQPGCIETKHHSILKLGRQELLPGQILPGCSHKRSFKYFVESIERRDCIFIGIKCENYQDFIDGKCINCLTSSTEEDICLTFGLSSKHKITPNFTYYLNTASESPFCLYPYAISIELNTNKDHFVGYFEMFLTDEDNHVANLSYPDDKNKFRYFKPKNENTYLYYSSHPKLSKLKEAKVKWNEKKTIFNKFKIKKKNIPVKRIKIEPITKGKIFITLFKPADCDESNDIPNGGYRNFKAYEIIAKINEETTTTTMVSTTTKKLKSTTKRHR